MSDLYRLANGLRKSTDQVLMRLAHERSLEISNYKDFFDFAEALLQPKSLNLAIAAISEKQLQGLRAINSGNKVSKETLNLLSEDLLVDATDPANPIIFDWLLEKLSEKPKTTTISLVLPVGLSPDQEAIDRDAGIFAFEAMQAITEILFDFDLHLVRDVSKGSIGLPDVKRLATHLRKEKEYVKDAFEMSKLAGLITLRDNRWQATKKADDWFEWAPEKRWQLLSASWQFFATDQTSNDILEQLKTKPDYQLKNLLRQVFPLAETVSGSRISKLSTLADFIGLTVDGFASDWLKLVLEKSFSTATQKLLVHLPKEQHRMIVQADLSLIAPGPLPAKTEVQLRKFAETESIGLASSYRISALSLSCGLESGLTSKEIEELLISLNDGPLPQPVDYLIRETAKRFGRLKVLQGTDSTRAIIESTDEFLIRQLARDSKLRVLNLIETGEMLTSNLEPEVVYHGLREAGYLAVRVDHDGKVISPAATHQSASETNGDPFQFEIERLRVKDGEVAKESPTEDMERKIQLALKNKSFLNIEITAANGDLLKFMLEPIGLANGRLRARDRKADIERTLPIASITSINIG